MSDTQIAEIKPKPEENKEVSIEFDVAIKIDDMSTSTEEYGKSLRALESKRDMSDSNESSISALLLGLARIIEKK